MQYASADDMLKNALICAQACVDVERFEAVEWAIPVWGVSEPQEKDCSLHCGPQIVNLQ